MVVVKCTRQPLWLLFGRERPLGRQGLSGRCTVCGAGGAGIRLCHRPSSRWGLSSVDLAWPICAVSMWLSQQPAFRVSTTPVKRRARTASTFHMCAHCTSHMQVHKNVARLFCTISMHVRIYNAGIVLTGGRIRGWRVGVFPGICINSMCAVRSAAQRKHLLYINTKNTCSYFWPELE